MPMIYSHYIFSIVFCSGKAAHVIGIGVVKFKRGRVRVREAAGNGRRKRIKRQIKCRKRSERTKRRTHSERKN
jgi:hypothetical protein